MSLIDDIAQHLEDNSIGTLGTDVFKSQLPETGSLPVIGVFDTGGTAPDIDLPTKSPTFQVYLRAATYTEGKNKLDAIRALLHRTLAETIGSTYFYYIYAISEGGHIGTNENGQDEFSINFRCLTR